MTKIDYYEGLNRDSKLTVELDVPTVAKEICAMNYGAHRLLSAMVRELRAKNMEYVNYQREKDAALPENRRLNLPAERERSPLADAIEAALNAGHTY